MKRPKPSSLCENVTTDSNSAGRKLSLLSAFFGLPEFNAIPSPVVNGTPWRKFSQVKKRKRARQQGRKLCET